MYEEFYSTNYLEKYLIGQQRGRHIFHINILFVCLEPVSERKTLPILKWASLNGRV